MDDEAGAVVALLVMVPEPVEDTPLDAVLDPDTAADPDLTNDGITEGSVPPDGNGHAGAARANISRSLLVFVVSNARFIEYFQA